MNSVDVQVALDRAMIAVPKLESAVSVNKCDLADATYSFLGVLEERAGFMARMGIGAVRTLIKDWKRKSGCP